MKKHCINLFTALIIFFSGCTKEEVTPRIYPRVITIEATDITSAGATFKGDITFSNVEIKDHGFLWSIENNPNVIQSNKISLGSKQGIGQFEAKIDRALQDGKKHYLRAYAISDDFVVYGNTVEFISLGSKAPVVKNFFPAIGTWGDTVTVVGENFSDEIRTNVVKFGDEGGPVVRANKDTLFVRVPLFLTKDLTTISVSIAGNSSHIEKQFQLRAPVIESVTPDVGLPGTKVVIKGKYLLGNATEIFFGEVEAAPLSWSSTQIECLVPNLPNAEVTLKVQTGSGNLSAVSPFKIQPEHLPELYQVQPMVAKFAETIKLIGNNFSPGQNSVKFGDVGAEIVYETNTEIHVVVPETQTRVTTITVTTLGSSVSIDGFSLKSPVISDFSPKRGAPGDEVIIIGSDLIWSHLKVFLGDEQLQITNVDDTHIYTRIPPWLRNHESTLKVTFYDEEHVLSENFKSPWVILDTFSQGALAGNIFVYNNAAYVTVVGPGQNSQVWKFNDDYQWNQLGDFPGSANGTTVSFTLGSKGYVGAGSINATEKVAEVWEFDLSGENWTQRSNIPLPNDVVTGFSVGSEGFAFDVDHLNQPNLWRYNATTDSWSLRSIAPVGITGFANNFVIGSSAYLIDGNGTNLWRYTPSSNQWTSRAAPPAQVTFAFSIGGFGYAGSNGWFYKYNPSINSWTQELMPALYDSRLVAFTMNGKAYVLTSVFVSNYMYEFDPNY